MKIDRTRNTARNIVWGVIEKILVLVIPFVTRTILLRLLGANYLGLNSLFSSILQVLNLADLGIGTAIVYSMYKPIADDDHDAVCALLNLYRKIFKVIGIIILIAGLCLMPFLRYFINGDVPDDVNIQIVFSIYLCNTVISYLMFAYKRSLLNALHRNDIITKINIVLLLLQSALQIGVLLIISNYYLYLLTLPIITLINNISVTGIVKKVFPEYACSGKVDKQRKKEIKKQVSGLFLNKLCEVSRNSLDSIFISMFVGLQQVAMYSNYFYILNGVHIIKGVINTSMLAGVGNSIACESVEKNYRDFKRFNFLYAWISGWCSCCLVCLYQHFMTIWVGIDLTFPFHIMLIFSVYLFAISVTDIKNVYMNAAGLWWEDRRRTILEFVVNLTLNFILGKYFGVLGILLATLITIIGINIIYGTYILYKRFFVEQKVSKFYVSYLLYFGVTIIVAVCTYMICSLLPDYGVIAFVVKMLMCIFIPNVLYVIFYHRTKIYVDSIEVVKSIVKRLF